LKKETWGLVGLKLTDSHVNLLVPGMARYQNESVWARRKGSLSKHIIKRKANRQRKILKKNNQGVEQGFIVKQSGN